MATRNYSDIPREEIGDFNNFLNELIEKDGLIVNGKTIEIIKLVIDKGFASLSDEQKYVFENAIDDYVPGECSGCYRPIPWYDMYPNELIYMCGECEKRLGRQD